MRGEGVNGPTGPYIILSVATHIKSEYALWTLAMIRQLITREFGVELSEVSVGRLMKRLGFTRQRPLRRAWQQDPELVHRWRAEEYPKIAARAKREGAMIFFTDESRIRADYHAGTTWSPKGVTPVVEATGARYGVLWSSDSQMSTQSASSCSFFRRIPLSQIPTSSLGRT